MARVRNWYNQSKPATLIWFISLITFYAVFRMASKVSPLSRAELQVSNAERNRMYDKMSRDLDEHGALFLKQGETSQSLLLSDLFDYKNGSVTPVLKAANPPVRANVLYMSPEYSLPISKAVRDIFAPTLDKGQDKTVQYSTGRPCTVFGVDWTEIDVSGTKRRKKIEAEANAVKGVAEKLCRMRIVLDRVVLTSTGVLLGLWQVISGSDPVTIRSELRNALPHAPVKQLYAPAILHTSLARIIGHPYNSSQEGGSALELQYIHELVVGLNKGIRGTEATISELWYVEEYDVLALALDGKMKLRRFKFGCWKG
uniref:Uncharacterized protein n=1 Tax=Lactuca sativa TaxID=4236 RepID=A0A9R1VB38_LACSA|nr:hypothetical protein LSAT_V11C500235950 [Lactuca sativa]